MNKIFRIVWSHATQSWVAVSELTKAHKKQSRNSLKAAVGAAAVLLSINTAEAEVLIGQVNNGTIAAGGSVVSSWGITIGGAIDKAGSHSVHVGDATLEEGERNVIIGTHATAGVDNGVRQFVRQSTAIGGGSAPNEGARAFGDQSIAIGANTIAEGNSSIAIGNDDVDKAVNKQLTYTNSEGNKVAGTLGDAYNNLTGKNLLYDGGQYVETRSGEAAVAIGVKAEAKDISVALGTSAKAKAVNTVAIGTGAEATLDNSVAIGGGALVDDKSQGTKQTSTTINGITYKWAGGDATNPGDVVSFGKPGYERQLKNIAAGEISNTSTDAINGSQIHSLVEKITGTPHFSYAGDDASTENVTAGTADEMTRDAEGKKQVVRSIEHGRLNLIGGADKTKLSDNNIGVTYTNGNTLTFKLAKELTGLTSSEFKDANNNVVNITPTGVSVAKPGATADNTVTLGQNGLNNGGNAITNVTSGLENHTEPGKTDLRNLDKNTVSDTTAATVGDLRHMGWVVSSNKTTGTDGAATDTAYSADVKNANEVRFVGKDGAIVSGTTDAATGVRTITVGLDKKAMSGSGASASPVAYTKADGTKVYPVKAENGSVTYHTTPNGEGPNDAVVPGTEVITSVNGPEGTTTPATLTNVAGNLVGAKKDTNAPTTEQVAPTLGKGANEVNPNNAATVGDVLNAGWNLQENGTAKDFVTPYDTVNFINGDGTTAVVETTDNKVSKIKYNVNTGNGLEKTTDNKIAVKPGDKSLEVTEAGVTVKKADQSLEVTDAGLKVKTDGTTITAGENGLTINTGDVNPVASGDKKGTVEVPTADAGKIATVDTVVKAVNSASFTLKVSATTDGTRNADSAVDENGEQIKAGSTVELVAGKNLDVKHDTKGKITFATKDNVTFETVQVGGDQGPKLSKSDAGDIKVSGSDGTAPVKVTNVKDGDISADSKDAINGSQFHKLAKNTIKLAGKNGEEAATETDTQTLDKENGIAFTVKSSDGKLLEVTAKGDTITLTPKVGSVTTDANGVPTADVSNGKLVTAEELVTALKGMGWKAIAGNDGTGTVTGNTEELVKAGETVTFKAGDNLAVKQAGKDFIYSLKTELTGLTSAEFKNAAGDKTAINADGVTITPVDTTKQPVSLTKDGLNNGGNAITNVAGNLDGAKKDTTTPKTEAAAPNTTNKDGDKYINPNNAATVGDVLNAGWNLQENGTAKDFVKPYDTVNFINGANTTAVVTTSEDGTTSKVTYNVTGLPVSYTTKDGKPVSKVGDKFYKVNEKGQPLAEDGTPAAGTDKDGNPITADGTVIKAIDPTVDPLKTALVNPNAPDAQMTTPTQLGNVANGADTFKPANDVKQANDGKWYNAADVAPNGAPKAGAQPVVSPLTTTNAAGEPLEKGADGNWYKPSELTNGEPNPGATQQTPADKPANAEKAGLVNFENSNPNNAATVGDLQNLGFIVSAADNGYTEQMRNANKVEFKGSNGVSVTGKTLENGTREITVSLKEGRVTNNVIITKADGTEVHGERGEDGKVYHYEKDPVTGQPKKVEVPVVAGDTVTNDGDAYVTGNSVATAIQKSGWNIGIGSTTKEFSKEEKVHEKVNPNDNVKYVNGDNTTVSMAVDSAEDKDGTKVTTTYVKFDVNAADLTHNTNGTVNGPVTAEMKKALDEAKKALADLPANATAEAKKEAEDKVNVAQANINKVGNPVATAQSVADAINNSGFTLTTSGNGGKKLPGKDEVINPGKKVDLAAGKNMTVKQDAEGKVTYATADEVNFSSVQFGGNGPKINAAGNNINIGDKDGNPTKITGVKAGDISPTSTDAVNGAQIYALSRGNVPNVKNITDAAGNTYNNVIVDENGTPILKTYNVQGQKEIITNSVVEAIHNMNEQGIKFFHSNDGVNRPKVETANSFDSSASGKFATAIGKSAVAHGDNAVAMGNSSRALGNDSIAIGTGNIVEANNSGAFGDPNVIKADATGSYAFGNNNVITTKNTFVLGNDVNNAGNSTSREGTVENSVYLGNKSTATAGDGSRTASLYNIKQDGTKGTSTTAGSVGTVTTATVGNMTYGGFQGAKANGVVSVGAAGDERRIQNVAAGEISSTSTDAINGSQLYSVANGIGNRINNLQGQINKLGKRMNAGVAGAMAAANLMQPHKPGQSAAMAAIGQHHGEAAVAVGYSRISDNGKYGVKLSVGANTQGQLSTGAGVSYFW